MTDGGDIFALFRRYISVILVAIPSNGVGDLYLLEIKMAINVYYCSTCDNRINISHDLWDVPQIPCYSCGGQRKKDNVVFRKTRQLRKWVKDLV